MSSQAEGHRLDIFPIHCRTCLGSCRGLLIIWSASIARTCLRARTSEELTDRSTRLHTLPFLKILVAACVHSRAMSNTLLANRLVRAVIPYLTKSILPQSETKNSETSDVGGSSKRKGKRRARGYEGDEVLKTNPGVLFGSLHEERVVALSIEGDRLSETSFREGLNVLS